MEDGVGGDRPRRRWKDQFVSPEDQSRLKGPNLADAAAAADDDEQLYLYPNSDKFISTLYCSNETT
jgi:hypothetical protein